MQKDFDKWNEIKKETENFSDVFGIHEREIWWASLGINIGVETNGKNKRYERPVIVIRKFNRQMVWIVPTTSRTKNEIFHKKFLFGGETYFACLTQIRTLSSKRFLRKVGMISDTDFSEIVLRIKGFLKNETPSNDGESRRPKP
jgi:mRNA interferase MazF